MSNLATSCRGVLAPLLALLLTACSGEETPVPPGALRGELVVYVATLHDGTSDRQYALRIGGDEANERLLTFERPPEGLTTGTVLDVWGASRGEHLAVDRFQVVPVSDAPLAGMPGLIERRAQALRAGQAYRPRSFAFVLVDVGGGVNISEAVAASRLFGNAMPLQSVKQYYIEASYGRQDLGGQVFGPFKFTMNGCNTADLARLLRAQVPGTFDHYLWYMGSRVTGCQWSGLAVAGTPDRPARDTWYNAAASCVVLVQEPGHNFGMRHSSSLRCPGAAFVDTPNGTCTHSEYGDRYDPMGAGCRHMNGFQKAYEGWLGGCNLVEVKSSGTFTLLPIELPCDGIQVLQIPMPKARPFMRSGGGGPAMLAELTHYYLELRTSRGFDQGLAPQVQVRVSGDTRLRYQRGYNTWILDMNPATTSAFDGLGAGGSFTDPAGGVKFTVESIDASKATVRVEIAGGSGAPTCLDGMGLVQLPGPGPESCNAAPATVALQPSANQPGADGGTRDATPVDASARDTGMADARPADAAGTADAPPPDAPPIDLAAAVDVGPGGAGGRGHGGAGGTQEGTTRSPVVDARPSMGGTDGQVIDEDEPVRPRDVTGGCGCRVAGPAPEADRSLVALVALLGFGMIVRRRRS